MASHDGRSPLHPNPNLSHLALECGGLDSTANSHSSQVPTRESSTCHPAKRREHGKCAPEGSTREEHKAGWTEIHSSTYFCRKWMAFTGLNCSQILSPGRSAPALFCFLGAFLNGWLAGSAPPDMNKCRLPHLGSGSPVEMRSLPLPQSAIPTSCFRASVSWK